MQYNMLGMRRCKSWVVSQYEGVHMYIGGELVMVNIRDRSAALLSQLGIAHSQ